VVGIKPRIRARCAQMAPEIARLDANLSMIARRIREARSDGIDLLVLPELATSGYSLTRTEARDCGLRADAAVFEELTAELDERLTVVFGFVEHHEGTLFNSAVVLRSGWEPAIYRKTHLWNTEKDLFAPGDQPPPVLEASFGMLGVAVCYDLEFPEMLRSLALRGADVLAIPTNWSRQPRPEGEHAPQVIQIMAAARASLLPIACCDRSGAERGFEWSESSVIVDRHGWVVGSCAGDSVADGELTLERGRSVSPRNHALDDRRPELYATD